MIILLVIYLQRGKLVTLSAQFFPPHSLHFGPIPDVSPFFYLRSLSEVVDCGLFSIIIGCWQIKV